jgi:hypothetical protein
MSRNFILFVIFVFFVVSSSVRAEGTFRGPNRVLIMADDLGYGELGC